MQISISEYLQQPQTELVGIYGHYCSLFKMKNNLAVNERIHFAFDQNFKRVKLSFVYDVSEKTIHDLYVKDESNSVSTELSAEDIKFITDILDAYLARVQKDVNRLTKEMRSDWGKLFKREVLETSGFSSYFSNECKHIEDTCKMNVVSYTMSNISRKNVFPFQRR